VMRWVINVSVFVVIFVYDEVVGIVVTIVLVC